MHERLAEQLFYVIYDSYLQFQRRNVYFMLFEYWIKQISNRYI